MWNGFHKISSIEHEISGVNKTTGFNMIKLYLLTQNRSDILQFVCLPLGWCQNA